MWMEKGSRDHLWHAATPLLQLWARNETTNWMQRPIFCHCRYFLACFKKGPWNYIFHIFINSTRIFWHSQFFHTVGHTSRFWPKCILEVKLLNISFNQYSQNTLRNVNVVIFPQHPCMLLYVALLEVYLSIFKSVIELGSNVLCISYCDICVFVCNSSSLLWSRSLCRAAGEVESISHNAVMHITFIWRGICWLPTQRVLPLTDSL